MDNTSVAKGTPARKTSKVEALAIIAAMLVEAGDYLVLEEPFWLARGGYVLVLGRDRQGLWFGWEIDHGVRETHALDVLWATELRLLLRQVRADNAETHSILDQG